MAKKRGERKTLRQQLADWQGPNADALADEEIAKLERRLDVMPRGRQMKHERAIEKYEKNKELLKAQRIASLMDTIQTLEDYIG